MTVIKGCSKRVVMVRDVNGSMFEEAIFIVRPHFPPHGESELLSEAGKLLKAGGEKGVTVGSGPLVVKTAVASPRKTAVRDARRLRDAVMVCLGFAMCAVTGLILRALHLL